MSINQTPVVQGPIQPEPEPTPVVEPGLPYSILSNCWAYVKYVYSETPSTATMLANLSDDGEIGVLYYASSNLYHYVVIESRADGLVTFTETNFKGHTKSTRTLSSAEFVGFYKLP